MVKEYGTQQKWFMVIFEDIWKVPTKKKKKKMIGTSLFGGKNAVKLSLCLFRFSSILEVQIFYRDGLQIRVLGTT